MTTPSGTNSDSLRLLSFAFASADLFLEIDDHAKIVFALGAGERVAGRPEAALPGLDWRDLVAPNDHAMISSVIAAMDGNRRRGPLTVRLALGGQETRCVSLCLLRLPPRKQLSMAISLSAPPPAAPEAGVYDAEAFAEEAERLLRGARTSRDGLGLSLIEMSGLQSALKRLNAEEAEQLDRDVIGSLRAQAYAGVMVGRLGPESFAVVGPRDEAPGDLSKNLMLAIGPTLEALGGVSPIVRQLAAPGEAPPAEHALRALKYAIDRFALEGIPEGSSLAETFSKAVQSTLDQAATFRAIVAERRFRLAFQPVISLQTDLLHHHEVLVRFEQGQSPFDTIRMAEELDLIEDLDMAIVEEALKVIVAGRKKPPRLAVNISGHSISQSKFIERLRAAVRKVRGAPTQLILEITESSRITDFASANDHIQQLRADGHILCLDDFGAGAASFAYLQRLQVDVVKIDGQYIRNLTDPREGALVRHLVSLFRELGVACIAEMVETDEVAAAARRAGVDFGQGFLFGRPAGKPEAIKARPAPLGRRVGAIERWG